MKKIVIFTLIITLSVLLLASCATIQFDRTLLQPSESMLSPKLPKLDVIGAETVSVGVSNQVESSSMLYTIFRREVENNICESIGLPAGSIQMELIYHDVQQHPGLTGMNLATLEFEVRVIDKEDNVIWSEAYTGEVDDSNFALAWTTSYSNAAANNATAKLAHVLIEELKVDLQENYKAIVQWL